MSARFSLLFFLKRRGGYVDGDLPIYLRITVNGQRSEVAIQRKCAPEKWCVKKGCMIGIREDAKELNAYILGIQTKVYEMHRIMVLENTEIDAALLKRRLVGGEESKRTFISVFAEHNLEIAKLVGKDYSRATIVKYNTCLNSLRAFVRQKYKASDINLHSLDYSFLKSFEIYLKTEQGIGHNTSMGYIKKVKKIAHLCIANRWITSNPFTAFKVSIDKTTRIFLSEIEMKSLARKEFKIQRLDEVRDMFLFSCYTGLAYVDVVKLTTDAIVRGVDGTIWIVVDRTKTGVMANIPLLPQAEKIIHKYKNHPKVIITGKLLPLISNQKVNAYLKEIAVLWINRFKLTPLHHFKKPPFAELI